MSFAILVTEENMSEIVFRLTPYSDTPKNLDTYLASQRDWYFCTYVTDRYGKTPEWTILPGHVLTKHYDYNTEDIKNQMTFVKLK